MKILNVNRPLIGKENFFKLLKKNRYDFDVLMFPFLNEEKIFFLEFSSGESKTSKILHLFTKVDLIGKFDEECEYEGFSIEKKISLELLIEKLNREVDELELLNLE